MPSSECVGGAAVRRPYVGSWGWRLGWLVGNGGMVRNGKP